MTDLFWPGDERAGLVFTPRSLLGSLVQVEDAWLRTLVDALVAPSEAMTDLRDVIGPDDVEAVALGAEASGNPVVPLVALLRERLSAATGPEAARWLHRGLTSQDVLDTALVLEARTTTGLLRADLDRTVTALVKLVEQHRGAVMAGRTLTQHAVPTTFGLKAATWLSGVLDARDDLRALRFPVQVGGAAGTLAAVAEVGEAGPLTEDLARLLRLELVVPWHTVRTPLTRYADALVRTTDALSHVANDVLLLSRPEIGELAEPSAPGRGGSSTMPHKTNPVLSVLVRRAGLAAPMLAAQLHLAAADQVDERAAGGWHTEWTALAQLSRHALTAASQAADLLAGLRVDADRMAQTSHAEDLLAEQASLADLTGSPHRTDPTTYLGATSTLIDRVLARAREERP